MINTSPYLEDKEFLKKFDNELKKEQYIRIAVLDFKTEQIKAFIEGKTTSGSCNLSGTSNMRRTASCGLVVDSVNILTLDGQEIGYANITEVQNLISLNKKIKIETGFINTLANLGYYPEESVIWFPLGVFVIKNASVTQNNSGINISLTLNDKCALVNGDMGGTFPAAMVLSEMETYNLDYTQISTTQLLIKDIIKYIMVNFGGEDVNNLIIEDIPDTILKVIKWNDSEKKLYKTEDNIFTLEPSNDSIEYNYGDIIGYERVPFVYPGKLECTAGETVAIVLDKIKNTLGNFEWFYDIYGKFHFQEIKNYLNQSVSQDQIKNAQNQIVEQDYLSVINIDKSVYTFDNQRLITSIANNPQCDNIKNDFIVWGTAKTANGQDKPIRYHLVFDQKPPVDEDKIRAGIIYENEKKLKQFLPVRIGENCFRFLLNPSEITDSNYSLLNNKNNYYLKRKFKKMSERR